MDKDHLFRFYSDLSSLDQRGSIIAEYVWIDGTDHITRCKARTITHKVTKLEDLPEWNYDGSSCY